MLTKGARTRAALVRAAIERFARDGYQGVSLSDIAADAGVSPTAVYRYFDDKESLFTAAVDADAEGLVVLARARLDVDVGPSLVDLLDLLSDGLAEAIADHPLVGRLLAGDRGMVTNRVLELPSLVELRGEIATLLEVLQGQGLVRASLNTKSAALALESIVLNHLSGLTSEGRSAGSIFYERWRAVVGLLEEALKP